MTTIAPEREVTHVENLLVDAAVEEAHQIANELRSEGWSVDVGVRLVGQLRQRVVQVSIVVPIPGVDAMPANETGDEQIKQDLLDSVGSETELNGGKIADNPRWNKP